MRDFVATDWKEILERNGLRTFEDFWTRHVEWFEPPNQRRGGWSGVARVELTLPDGGRRGIFLKRQENHTARTLRHPLRGVPTFCREFQNVMLYRRLGLPTLVPVYFGQRRVRGKARAVLVTEEMIGFRSLEAWMAEWDAGGWPGRALKLKIAGDIALTLRSLHENHLRHNCFHPKHIFLRLDPADGTSTNPAVSIRLIDLEKTRWNPATRVPWWRDLGMLALRSEGWSNADRMRFYKSYLNVDRLSPGHKRIWRRILSRIQGRVELRKKRGVRAGAGHLARAVD